MLLGDRLTDPQHGTEVDAREPRIPAGVLLAAPGRAETLTEYATEHYPVLSTIDFTTMTTPALVVAGDHDSSTHLTNGSPALSAATGNRRRAGRSGR